jgi:hypothetical protein
MRPSADCSATGDRASIHFPLSPWACPGAFRACPGNHLGTLLGPLARWAWVLGQAQAVNSYPLPHALRASTLTAFATLSVLLTEA